jgi:hypothetical protein
VISLWRRYYPSLLGYHNGHVPLTICQVCGGPLARNLEKHPHCKPRIVPPLNRS